MAIYPFMVSTILSSGTDLTVVGRRVNLTEWGRCFFNQAIYLIV